MRSVTDRGVELGCDERSRRTGAFFAAVLSSLCLAAPAIAGMVSGVVRNERGPLPGTRIEMKDSRGNRYIATTDRNGRYTVNLSPGLYKTTISGDRRGRMLILQSSPQPSRQDLDFGRR